VGVGMADGDYCMAAVEVEVFGTFVVPHLATLSFYYIDVEKGIYVI
jgi:hypothetical protein